MKPAMGLLKMLSRNAMLLELSDPIRFQMFFWKKFLLWGYTPHPVTIYSLLF
ncbi:hypothetical protein H6H02_00980 [Coleofasciculus sp. FACHB-1120]|nr:hypothetical protein [Coleofasciculus sp. FACHB-1120]